MTVPWWVMEAAAGFWAEVGAPAPFPRDLRGPIAAALPLAVFAQPSLSTDTVRAWLRRRALADPFTGPDRPLRACLVARDGGGVILLDAADGEDEQRFSLAHELAHFLRHHGEPRRRASERLGGWAVKVLEGRRPARPLDEIRALLAGVSLACHGHLMERTRPSRTIAVAEEEADRLAYELLAPAEAVAARLGQARDATEAGRLLEDLFGLPRNQARAYAEVLLPAPPADPLVQALS